MPDIVDLTVSEFLRQLAAEQPTPGGGSAAALTGALAACLVCMVCAYTIGRERYRDVDKVARRLLARAQELQGDFERATDADAAAIKASLTRSGGRAATSASARRVRRPCNGRCAKARTCRLASLRRPGSSWGSPTSRPRSPTSP